MTDLITAFLLPLCPGASLSFPVTSRYNPAELLYLINPRLPPLVQSSSISDSFGRISCRYYYWSPATAVALVLAHDFRLLTRSDFYCSEKDRGCTNPAAPSFALCVSTRYTHIRATPSRLYIRSRAKHLPPPLPSISLRLVETRNRAATWLMGTPRTGRWRVEKEMKRKHVSFGQWFWVNNMDEQWFLADASSLGSSTVPNYGSSRASHGPTRRRSVLVLIGKTSGPAAGSHTPALVSWMVFVGWDG
ncbi:hypothetical protein B0H16DRAFT_1481601 [Mycena metata]|uniref:Uncharacterized protein n=1 Tax=Mycena metata TaxID=1033252 RepID=A0AAD7GXB7_9AGAR|nr:hypothetical protein B0H16DRAFT_1481601 [Mycena metata]